MALGKRTPIDLTLFLPALFIAFVIWLIAKQGELSETSVRVPVQLTGVPPYLKVEVEPPEVELNVRCPRELAQRVLAANFAVTVDVSDRFWAPSQWPQPTEPVEIAYTLNPRRDVRTLLPSSVQVTLITQPTLRLRGSLITQTADIEVATTGRLPSTIELIAPPRPDPDRALVTGSPDALRQLVERAGNRIATQPIDLSTVRESMQFYRTLDLPEGLILLRPADPNITIYVGVTERPTTRTLDQVPISIVTYTEGLRARITPPVMSIDLYGPPSKLNTIGPTDFVFTPTRPLEETPGKPQEVGIEVRLGSQVPSDTALKVELREWRPPRITVEFVPEDALNGTVPEGSTEPAG